MRFKFYCNAVTLERAVAGSILPLGTLSRFKHLLSPILLFLCLKTVTGLCAMDGLRDNLIT